MFDEFTAKFLYLSKQVRQDTSTHISFFFTQVNNMDEDDWKKLIRYMRYICGTNNLPLNSRKNGTGMLNCHVNASYAVHWDCWKHTLGTLSLETGSIISDSICHNMYTKSSAVAELVEEDNMSPHFIWKSFFVNTGL